MDELDRIDSPQTSLEFAEITAAYRALKTLFHVLAIAMLILMGTLFVFFYREVVVTRRQTRELSNYVAEYEKANGKDLIAVLQTRLGSFAQTNTDFKPIYIKYFGTNPPPVATQPAPPRAVDTLPGK